MLSYQELASLARELGDEPVLSVYLDAAFDDPARRTAWRVQVDNSIKAIRRELEAASHQERMGFDHCVQLLDHELAAFSGGVGAPGWVAFITAHGVRLPRNSRHPCRRLPSGGEAFASHRTFVC